MAWTNPRTWLAGEVVTAALLNTHLRENLKHLGPRAAGSEFIASPVASLVVTFPAGRFSVAPIVNCTMTTGGNVAVAVNVQVTSTNFTAYFYGIGGTWSSGSVSMFWTAVPLVPA